ncbi:prolactin-releasing peptide [Patagioenas fasciata monilis]|uniref:Prolactin-releasing peptide n=2 Tax=Patagioenas fasciata TaxID=372321 RepID=A0A1V4K8N4_PATFA|nr:prolactin-releasing peptide [Patagioenas fasciata monilis]
MKPAIKTGTRRDSGSDGGCWAQRDNVRAPRLTSPRCIRSLCLRGTSRKHQGALGPSHHDQRVPGMKLGAACLLCLLLTCLTLPVTHSRVYERSMEIRNPDIDPSWYTGRGIRPVGRFGRRRALGEGTHPGGAGRWQACGPSHLHPQPARKERSP